MRRNCRMRFSGRTCQTAKISSGGSLCALAFHRHSTGQGTCDRSLVFILSFVIHHQKLCCIALRVPVASSLHMLQRSAPQSDARGPRRLGVRFESLVSWRQPGLSLLSCPSQPLHLFSAPYVLLAMSQRLSRSPGGWSNLCADGTGTSLNQASF